MQQPRADFHTRLSRLPRREIPQTYTPVANKTLGSALSPLIFVLSAVIGFVNFFLLPYIVRSFTGKSDALDVSLTEEALDAIWMIPSIGLAFAGSVVFMSVIGLTGGGHFKAATVGIALALAMSRAF